MQNLELNEGERLLVESVYAGLPADFRQAFPQEGTAPAVRAEVIRRLLLALPICADPPPCLPRPLPTGGVVATGMRIQGSLNLRDSAGTRGEDACAPLVLTDCRFETGDAVPTPADRPDWDIDLAHARIVRLALVNCQLSCINLSNAWLAGDLDISGLHGRSDDALCWVYAPGARVGGTVRALGARLNARPKADHAVHLPVDHALDLIGGHVTGSVLLRAGFRALGGVKLPTSVEGDVWIDGATVHAYPGQNAVRGQSVRIGGVLVMRPCETPDQVHPFHAIGSIVLYGAVVGGTVDLSGAQLDVQGSDTNSLHAPMLSVGGWLLIGNWADSRKNNHRACIQGSVSLDGASVGGGLTLCLVSVPADADGGPDGVTADASRTRQDMCGPISARNMRIERDVFVEYLPASGDEGAQLDLGDNLIGGKLEALVCGKLSLRGTQTTKDMTIRPPEGRPATVDATNCTVGGDLFLRGTFDEVMLWGVRIQGQLAGRDNTVVGRMNATEARIGSSTFLSVAGSLEFNNAWCEENVIIVSTARTAEALLVHATGSRFDKDVSLRGRLGYLALTSTRIGGGLELQDCNVSRILATAIRVEGPAQLPRDLLGPANFKGSIFRGGLQLAATTRLHASGPAAKPSYGHLNLEDVEICGDLQIADVQRHPPHGLLDIVESHDGLLVYERELVCFPDACVLEFHRPSSSCAPTERRATAFLAKQDGSDAVLLSGDAAAIHDFAKRQKLLLETEEQVAEYLRLFCAYTWGAEGGAFQIVERTDMLPALVAADSADQVRIQPYPMVVWKEENQWRAKALMVYGAALFEVLLKAGGGSEVEMLEDTELLKLQPRALRFDKPVHYFPAALEGEAWLFQGTWKPLKEEEAVRRWIGIVGTGHTTAEQRIDESVTLPVRIDLRGCRCDTLDDQGGAAWGMNVTADLRGFQYADIADAPEAPPPVAAAPAAPPADPSATTTAAGGLTASFETRSAANAPLHFGRDLGESRLQWLARITDWQRFSPQPYEHLVSVLNRRGDHEAARRVLLHRMKKENDHAPRALRWSVRCFVQWPFQYGLFWRNALWTSLAYILVGTYVFDLANYGAVRLLPFGAASHTPPFLMLRDVVTPVLMVDSQPVNILAAPKGGRDVPVTAVASGVDVAEDLSCGEQVESVLYALDVMLPVLELHQEEKCAISGDDGALAWRIFKALYALLGAYVSSMTILTISGVLRRNIER